MNVDSLKGKLNGKRIFCAVSKNRNLANKATNILERLGAEFNSFFHNDINLVIVDNEINENDRKRPLQSFPLSYQAKRIKSMLSSKSNTQKENEKISNEVNLLERCKELNITVITIGSIFKWLNKYHKFLLEANEIDDKVEFSKKNDEENHFELLSRPSIKILDPIGNTRPIYSEMNSVDVKQWKEGHHLNGAKHRNNISRSKNLEKEYCHICRKGFKNVFEHLKSEGHVRHIEEIGYSSIDSKLSMFPSVKEFLVDRNQKWQEHKKRNLMRNLMIKKESTNTSPPVNVPALLNSALPKPLSEQIPKQESKRSTSSSSSSSSSSSCSTNSSDSSLSSRSSSSSKGVFAESRQKNKDKEMNNKIANYNKNKNSVKDDKDCNVKDKENIVHKINNALEVSFESLSSFDDSEYDKQSYDTNPKSPSVMINRLIGDLTISDDHSDKYSIDLPYLSYTDDQSDNFPSLLKSSHYKSNRNSLVISPRFNWCRNCHMNHVPANHGNSEFVCTLTIDGDCKKFNLAEMDFSSGKETKKTKRASSLFKRKEKSVYDINSWDSLETSEKMKTRKSKESGMFDDSCDNRRTHRSSRTKVQLNSENKNPPKCKSKSVPRSKRAAALTAARGIHNLMEFTVKSPFDKQRILEASVLNIPGSNNRNFWANLLDTSPPVSRAVSCSSAHSPLTSATNKLKELVMTSDYPDSGSNRRKIAAPLIRRTRVLKEQN